MRFHRELAHSLRCLDRGCYVFTLHAFPALVAGCSPSMFCLFFNGNSKNSDMASSLLNPFPTSCMCVCVWCVCLSVCDVKQRELSKKQGELSMTILPITESPLRVELIQRVFGCWTCLGFSTWDKLLRVLLGVNSSFFSAIVLFKNQRKKDPWKEWGSYP